ncbi:hypothetical protein BO71DRAFT_402086 [Aspergillus ellipticus CBS 707.79]|uniref:Uncharacterized protein n=1 Tax=Aspergillus ellipticus CBS 707.79 TaxID=1448320 RepID=A0A319CZT2_9EURO|nr:hypothetical protein BO71DRAFT_402086 [Aspergillus ellipticus CBS 707.79]
MTLSRGTDVGPDVTSHPLPLTNYRQELRAHVNYFWRMIFIAFVDRVPRHRPRPHPLRVSQQESQTGTLEHTSHTTMKRRFTNKNKLKKNPGLLPSWAVRRRVRVSMSSQIIPATSPRPPQPGSQTLPFKRHEYIKEDGRYPYIADRPTGSRNRQQAAMKAKQRRGRERGKKKQ